MFGLEDKNLSDVNNLEHRTLCKTTPWKNEPHAVNECPLLLSQRSCLDYRICANRLLAINLGH